MNLHGIFAASDNPIKNFTGGFLERKKKKKKNFLVRWLNIKTTQIVFYFGNTLLEFFCVFLGRRKGNQADHFNHRGALDFGGWNTVLQRTQHSASHAGCSRAVHHTPAVAVYLATPQTKHTSLKVSTRGKKHWRRRRASQNMRRLFATDMLLKRTGSLCRKNHYPNRSMNTMTVS